MERALYNLGSDGKALVEAWISSQSRPAIFLSAPAVKDVGEIQLLNDLAAAVYEISGFADSPSRHFMFRNFPHEGSQEDYARFMDDPREVAEITDGFFGVDCIDLSAWVDKDTDKATWRRLMDHVRRHPETDFVFLVYTDSLLDARRLESVVRVGCGLSIVSIDAEYPYSCDLVTRFDECTAHQFENELEQMEEWIDCLREKGKPLNYSAIDALATSAVYEAIVEDGVQGVLSRLLDRYERHVGMEKSSSLGF